MQIRDLKLHLAESQYSSDGSSSETSSPSVTCSQRSESEQSSDADSTVSEVTDDSDSSDDLSGAMLNSVVAGSGKSVPIRFKGRGLPYSAPTFWTTILMVVAIFSMPTPTQSLRFGSSQCLQVFSCGIAATELNSKSSLTENYVDHWSDGMRIEGAYPKSECSRMLDKREAGFMEEFWVENDSRIGGDMREELFVGEEYAAVGNLSQLISVCCCLCLFCVFFCFSWSLTAGIFAKGLTGIRYALASLSVLFSKKLFLFPMLFCNYTMGVFANTMALRVIDLVAFKNDLVGHDGQLSPVVCITNINVCMALMPGVRKKGSPRMLSGSKL